MGRRWFKVVCGRFSISTGCAGVFSLGLFLRGIGDRWIFWALFYVCALGTWMSLGGLSGVRDK